MNDALVFALLFVAVACGWLLGRRGARSAAQASQALPSQYYRGLNYLLDGRPDGARTIAAIPVSRDSIDHVRVP